MPVGMTEGLLYYHFTGSVNRLFRLTIPPAHLRYATSFYWGKAYYNGIIKITGHLALYSRKCYNIYYSAVRICTDMKRILCARTKQQVRRLYNDEN